MIASDDDRRRDAAASHERVQTKSELGARAEQQKIDVDADLPDYDETAISLSAGTVWEFADEHALALNLTRTQRNPQAAELYANGPHIAAQRFEIGDVNLDQETSVTADLSLRHTGEQASCMKRSAEGGNSQVLTPHDVEHINNHY